MELFNVTLGLKSVLGKSFSVVDFTTIKRVGREKETIRDVLVGFVRQNDRDYVLATTKTSGKLMTFQKRQKLAKVPCTRICAHHEPLRAQQLGYLLKVRSQLIYKLNFARRDIIMDEYAEPEPTLQVKSHIYSASQLPHDIYGDVGAFVSKTLRSQQLTEKTE